MSTEFDPSIDKHALDEEWVRQPEMYYHWAKKLAEAQRKADELKDKINAVKADIDQDVRDRPANYGLSKVTESGVLTAVLGSEKYQAAQAEYRGACYEVGILDAAVKSLEHRKKALESLVYLHGQSYFAEPVARGQDAEAMEDIQKRSARARGVRQQIEEE